MIDPPLASSPESRQYALLARLLPWTGVLVPGANVFAPLVVLLLAPDDPFVRDHVMDEVNFQLFWTILLMVLIVGTCGLGAVLAIPFAIVALILEVQGAIAASNGLCFRYPGTPRLLT